MDSQRFPIDGLVEVVPRRISDERGYFSEVHHSERFRAQVANTDFVQENESLSVRAGTIRGIHFQTEPFAQGKLVRCLAGSIFDVAVDLRHDSDTFAHWIGVTLSAATGNQLWIPAGFGHAFCSLEPNCIVSYRVTAYYSPNHDKGLAWDDSDIAIEWPELADPETLSPKDRQHPKLCELPHYFSVEA